MGQYISNTSGSRPTSSDVMKALTGLACLVDADYVDPCSCAKKDIYNPNCQTGGCNLCGRGNVWTLEERQALESFIIDVNNSLNETGPNTPWSGDLDNYIHAGLYASLISNMLEMVHSYTLLHSATGNGGHPGFGNSSDDFLNLSIEDQQSIAAMQTLINMVLLMHSDRTSFSGLTDSNNLLYYFQYFNPINNSISVDYDSMNTFLNALSKIHFTNDTISSLPCNNIVIVTKPCVLICGQLTEYGLNSTRYTVSPSSQKIYCGTFMTTQVSTIVIPNGTQLQEPSTCHNTSCSNNCGGFQGAQPPRQPSLTSCRNCTKAPSGRIGQANRGVYATFAPTCGSAQVQGKPCRGAS